MRWRSRRCAAPAGREYRFRLRARSFLHNQVRGIVGTLERVGAGAWPPERVGEALAARDRAACGPVCPPDGLYLVAVRYPVRSVRRGTIEPRSRLRFLLVIVPRGTP